MAELSDFKPAYFDVDERGAVVVAHITRPGLSEEENIEQLGQELTMLVDQFGCRKLAVNFEVVSLITSAALGKFISLHRNLHRREGRLVLCGVASMVKDVLDATRLSEYFSLTKTIDEAVALLSGDVVGGAASTAS